MKFAIYLEQGSDGGWAAIAPDIPGLLLAAATKEELLATASAVIADYLDALRDEDLPIPKPTTHEFAVIVVAA